MDPFQVGDTVITPDGPGTVQYCRFGPPDYTQVVAYSVKLETRKGEYNYGGSMFPSEFVSLLKR